MRYRWDKKYLYWGVTAVAVIIAGLLLFAAIFRFDMIWGFFGTIFGILTPVLYGFAFAFILNPVVKRLHKLFMKTVFKKTKKVHRAEKISRAISIVISILLLFVVITVFSLMLFPQLVTNIMGFYNNFESYYNNFMGWLDGILKQDSKSAEFIFGIGKIERNASKLDVNRFGSSITKYCNQFTFRFMECIYGLKRCHYWFNHCHLLSIQ